jgi:lipoate-protein ligase A
MAVDEALLESAGRGASTLRFYEWAEPTLSLGYFQAVAERAGHAASRDCPLVRRASGGGAILHDRELTYSLAVPDQGRFAAADWYDLFHRSLVETLGKLGVTAELCQMAGNPSPLTPLPQGERGEEEPPARWYSSRHTGPQRARGKEPFLCFQRHTPGDVLAKGVKIAGSAQRRHKGAILQHGSVLLTRSESAPELPGIAQEAGIIMDARGLAEAWLPPLSRAIGWKPQVGVLTDDERAAAQRYERDRFSTPDWNYRK